jgi:signal transduction histidine kinase
VTRENGRSEDLRRRSTTRFAWSLFGLTIALFIAYFALVYLDRSIRLHVYGYIGAVPIDCLAFGLLGAMVASRLPRNPMGWLFLGIGITLVATSDAQLYAIRGLLVASQPLPLARAAGWLGTWLWAPGVFVTATFVPLLFPDGSPPGRGWRTFAKVAAGVMTLQWIGAAVLAYPNASSRLDASGQFNTLSATTTVTKLFGISYALLVPLSLGAVLSLRARMRSANDVERQQLKFFIYAFVIVLLGVAASAIGNTVGSSTGTVYDVGAGIFVTTIAAIPIAAGLAILRYRLYGIDVVISRTIVYGTLAALISGVYVAIVVGIGSAVGSAGRNNVFLSILATALVALAFQPARSRLQLVANRIVYGRRASPYEVLSTFSEGIGETYTDEDVLTRMARLLAGATDADAVEVWVRAGRFLRSAASFPDVPSPAHVPVAGEEMPSMPAPVAVPVRHSGDLLGAITIVKRGSGELTPVEAKLVDDLARQAGLVLRNAGLTETLKQRLEELRASRERLVTAQDSERRRIERNLHDGAQQHLVALKVKVGLLETMLHQNPELAASLVSELKDGADEALQTLRDLARGIYPPLLADRGLAAAVEAQLRKATVPATLETDGLGRYRQEIEAAVYFCCLEALQNVQKYAGATRATVRLYQRDGTLVFEVSDDGAGFDPDATPRGSGLTNMADRLDALGGTIEVESALGRGTVVRGTLPALT